MDREEAAAPVNELDIDSGVYEEPQEEQVEAQEAEPQEDRTDWKAQAIEARTRLEMLQKMREEQSQQQQAPQVDEATQIRQQIEAKRAELPTREQMNKDANLFWQREQVMDEINLLQEKLVDARLKQQERLLAEQHVSGAVNQYKARFANRQSFKAVEQQFDQMVSQLEPHLRGNTVMLDMIRSKLELDHMDRSKGQKAPPRAPGSDYQPQAQAQARSNQGKVTWRSDADRQVGEYYMSRGIISGPEEFYDPKYSERSPSANNNGTAIYDVPNTPRGWRR